MRREIGPNERRDIQLRMVAAAPHFIGHIFRTLSTLVTADGAATLTNIDNAIAALKAAKAYVEDDSAHSS